MAQRVDKLAINELPCFLMLTLPRQSKVCIALYDHNHLEAPWTLRIRNTETEETTLAQYVLQRHLEEHMRKLGSMHQWLPLAVENGRIRDM
jgi:hypothetical protein